MGMLGSLKEKLPESWRYRLARWRRPRWLYLLSKQTKPISNYAGRERGEPIDRYYIEDFLARHSAHVKGRVLEVKDAAYTRRFGAERVTQSDVLDINPQNKQANVIGDLRNLSAAANDTYDCFICTQTFQYLDDLPAAVAECHRILKPGGVLLATLPCLGKVEGLEPNVAGNFWRFTPHAAKYLFAKVFEKLEVNGRGNALAGMAFWVGMAQQDLGVKRLTNDDPAFPVIVTVRAVK